VRDVPVPHALDELRGSLEVLLEAMSGVVNITGLDWSSNWWRCR